MSDVNNNNPLGQDSIKGGIFFGSNLTPGGTFSNIPQTSATPPPLTAQDAKIILTLQQVKEELQKSASSQLGVHTDILSDTAVNTFLQSYVQLLIDYSDMRNYVFFGSAYTELSYQINYLTANYPFKAFFAKDASIGLITLTPIAGGNTKVSFNLTDILQPGGLTYDTSGITTWVNFDLVDLNGTRFPITNAILTHVGPLTFMNLTVTGTMSVNNFVEYTPTIGTTFKGYIISPRLQTLKDFEVALNPIQIELLNLANPMPWPRDVITNNIIITGTPFDNWVADPNNMLSGYNADQMGLVSNTDPIGLTLTSGMTLDDTITNQLIRRAVPHRLIDELRDTDDKFFTRFILLAGKLFDTIKVYIDFLKYTKELNYSPFNQLSPDFYRLYAEHYGFDLFDDESIDLAKAIISTEAGLSYDNQNNAVYNDTATSKSVQELQNEKQKRLLVNLFYLYSTKGTLKCINILARLLGAPNGLVVFNEKVFDQTTGQKITDNEKIKVPQIAYEIDPDFLVDQNNVNSPVNFPYVYRLKLDNDNIVNLRELDGFTDPQGAIQEQVIEYGTKTYPYGHFSHRSFATLQNSTNALGYYLLPLTFPDKYCGITVEYMLPRDAYTKGVASNLDEATIHLGSLFKVAQITYTDSLNPTKPDLISANNKYVYNIPQIFLEGILPDEASLTIPYSASFTINTINGIAGVDLLEALVGGTPIGGCYWQSTKKATALAITNAINFQGDTNDYIAFYKEGFNGDYTITVESKRNSTMNILPGLILDVQTNAVNDSTIIGSYQTMADGTSTTTTQFLIAKIEGNDLVVRASLSSEVYHAWSQRVAILENVFTADGLNHELRLIYRAEGVEVYQDFKYLGLARWREPASVFPFHNALNCPKNLISTLTISQLGSLFAYPDEENTYNSGHDAPAWWDLLVGLPVGIDMFFKRVAVQEIISINQPDSIDFGVNISGQDVEKFSFNFINQAKNTITGEYLYDRISVPCDYRSPFPFAPMAPNPSTEPDGIDLTFEAYTNKLVTDLTLTSQTYLRGGEARFTQDIQNFFKLSNGETITIDSLFKFNGWSATIHKDYTYKNFNEVYNNYQIFSEQVLTYLSLLSFMELVEDKFKKLIGQFIPIVINVSKFGRLIRQLEKQKVHYPNIHHVCDGNLIGCPSRGSFRIVHGSNNEYANLNNNLTINIQITKFISNATNASPIVITTSVLHNFINGDTITVADVLGNVAANGTWIIANKTDFTFELATSVGTGAYTSGGTAIKIIDTFGPFDWASSNVLTAQAVSSSISATGVISSANLNTVILDIDPTLFLSATGNEANDCSLVVLTNSNVQVDSVKGFEGGYGSITTGGCFNITVLNDTPVASGFTQQFIYFAAEQGPDTYIYLDSEVFSPEPHFYIN